MMGFSKVASGKDNEEKVETILKIHVRKQNKWNLIK